MENLDSFETPKGQKVAVSEVLPPGSHSIESFPAVKGTPFRDFRTAVFHCECAPTLARFRLDDDTTRRTEDLHRQIEDWINAEFRSAFEAFERKYNPAPCCFFGPMAESSCRRPSIQTRRRRAGCDEAQVSASLPVELVPDNVNHCGWPGVLR